MTTETAAAVQFPVGARIEVRDEEWLVRSATWTGADGYKIKVIGVSELVLDEPATFFSAIDKPKPLRPEDTQLVSDGTPNFRRSRLYLEAVLRRTPVPRAETGLALAGRFLADPLAYQTRPAEIALRGLRPRILLADVVGLGKTLEIGLLLAELIRRGRGERLLVVTPQHVLEQFQHELWTRFSIPLVRLDSVGIQRIAQEIPAGRNPFTYFKRAIISIDTLKDTGTYGHHLDAIDWDAVVIDESHNVMGASSRAKLAKRLAPHADALILASATPHNGDARSFADLISLLDPTAIADPRNYSAEDLHGLYIRRTKIDPEVRDQIGRNWADRGPSVSIHCPAGDNEEAVFDELTRAWLGKDGAGRAHLFSYTLLKAFLSSHRALRETIKNRLLGEHPDPGEVEDLKCLDRLAAAIGDDDSAKLAALVDYLTEIGVGPGKDTRVVIFSERRETLRWLAEVLPKRLGFTEPGAVEQMDGGLTDVDQMATVQRFGRAGEPVRVLVTGDVASEGVNLHRECHHLVHFDIPWSLIRIEQRNGRIDRYGQVHEPQFRALILTSAIEGAKDDRTVAEKLLAREENAHRSLGSAEAVTGIYDAKKEEQRLVRTLLRGGSVEDVVDTAPQTGVLATLLSNVGAVPVAAEPPRARIPTLFASTERFVDEALSEIYGTGDELDLRREDAMIAFDAPKDLERRLLDLPRGYLAQQRDREKLRLRLTFDRAVGQRKLDEARKAAAADGTGSTWPDVGFVSDVHPAVDWLIDKVLIRLDRNQAPVLRASVAEPVYLVQGVYCNVLGQPTVVSWMAVSGLPDSPVVRPMPEVLAEAGIGPSMPNPGLAPDLAELTGHVPEAIGAARAALEDRRAEWDERVRAPLDEYRRRLDRWAQDSLFDAGEVAQTRHRQTTLIDQLETTGEPLLRLLAVLEGGSA